MSYTFTMSYAKYLLSGHFQANMWQSQSITIDTRDMTLERNIKIDAKFWMNSFKHQNVKEFLKRILWMLSRIIVYLSCDSSKYVIILHNHWNVTCIPSCSETKFISFANTKISIAVFFARQVINFKEVICFVNIYR